MVDLRAQHGQAAGPRAPHRGRRGRRRPRGRRAPAGGRRRRGQDRDRDGKAVPRGQRSPHAPGRSRRPRPRGPAPLPETSPAARLTPRPRRVQSAAGGGGGWDEARRATAAASSSGSTGLARWSSEAGPQRARHLLRLRVGGDGHRGRGAAVFGGQGPHPRDQREAVLAGQSQVADHHVGPERGQRVEGLAGGGGLGHGGPRPLEHGAQGLAPVGVVVHQQHAHATQPDRLRPGGRRPARCGGPGQHGQAHGEGGAAVRPLAVRLHAAAVQLHQVARRWPGPGPGRRGRGCWSASAWRKRSNTCGRNSGAMPTPVVTRPRAPTWSAAGRRRDAHTAAGGRELDGVGEQVPHHLLQAVGVAAAPGPWRPGGRACSCRPLRLGRAGAPRPPPPARRAPGPPARASRRSLPETMRDTSRMSSMSWLCSPRVALDRRPWPRCGAGGSQARPCAAGGPSPRSR